MKRAERVVVSDDPKFVISLVAAPGSKEGGRKRGGRGERKERKRGRGVTVLFATESSML